MISRFLAVLTLLAAGGCATQPLPDDVTGLKSYNIVRQIRCETREAIREIVVGYLESRPHRLMHALAERYRADPASIKDFDPKLLVGQDLQEPRELVTLFFETGIAFGYDFDITEQNDLSTGLNFLKPLQNPVVKLNIGAGVHRTRQNLRTFTTTDTFRYLLTKLPERYCDNFVVADSKRIYPIVGRIGVEKSIKDFIELTLFGGLDGGDKKPGIPTMTDDLTFTTRLTGSVTPRIEFAPISSGFRLLDGSITAKAERIDKHNVTIGLAVAKAAVADLDPVRNAIFAERPGLVVGRRVTGGGTLSEQLAVAAIDQVKSRELRLVATP